MAEQVRTKLGDTRQRRLADGGAESQASPAVVDSPHLGTLGASQRLHGIHNIEELLRHMSSLPNPGRNTATGEFPSRPPTAVLRRFGSPECIPVDGENLHVILSSSRRSVNAPRLRQVVGVLPLAWSPPLPSSPPAWRGDGAGARQRWPIGEEEQEAEAGGEGERGNKDEVWREHGAKRQLLRPQRTRLPPRGHGTRRDQYAPCWFGLSVTSQ